MENNIKNKQELLYILMGEDDKFISKIYKTRLEKEGYLITQAFDGEEVLKMARKKVPDLILLDLILPIKNGFETLEELKADSVLRNVKVVVLSNLDQEDFQKRVMDLGAEEYIVKAKASFEDLVATVKRHIK